MKGKTVNPVREGKGFTLLSIRNENFLSASPP
jgi:hypothetical protein